jgi:hypothetical protein
MSEGRYILKFEARGVIAALLSGKASTGKITRDAYGASCRVGIVILILPLVLKAGFIGGMIVN